ncbi:replication initiator protein A [Candidatus Williamhamiltonella defendens]|uniref:replication initiator protein A n=1 Tax=Candidatus Williamhamiltonella defendens TaxID=138072 RepID=UPI00036CD299|nr:replication initiator protein A [Candidatus Hamiltonella defensa]
MANHTINQRVSKLKTLRPRKHDLEFFIADEVELSSFRDEMASMEHPFFALKGGDTKVRKYKNGNVTVIVKATADGLATVFDKDVWIYSISKLQEAINNHQEISRTICFTPYDFFVTTNRTISGRTYQELERALDRLKAIDRRLYEIARKHCGHQGEFTIALEKLHLKTGSTALLKMFRHNIKQLAKTNDLPDYGLRYDAKADMVIFNNRNLTPEQEEKEQQRENGKREIYKLKNLLAAKRGGK